MKLPKKYKNDDLPQDFFLAREARRKNFESGFSSKKTLVITIVTALSHRNQETNNMDDSIANTMPGGTFYGRLSAVGCQLWF